MLAAPLRHPERLLPAAAPALIKRRLIQPAALLLSRGPRSKHRCKSRGQTRFQHGQQHSQAG